jgi:phosphoglucan,water dikinase
VKTDIFIGNQTSCWAPPLAPFDYAVAQGFNAFEWFPDKKPGVGWDETDFDPAQRAQIRETAHALGMRLSVHARWQANPLDPACEEMFRADLELAKDLGARLLNIHLCHESGLSAFVEAIRPLLRQTAEAGLQLAIENTPFHTPEVLNELFARLSELPGHSAAHAGLCLDIGHANLCAATLNDYLGFVDRLSPQVPLIHLHLHENWGDADRHLPLFTGPAAQNDAGIRGLVERLRRRRFTGSLILEQWPQPPTLLNQARDRLTRLLEVFPAQKEHRKPAHPRHTQSGHKPEAAAELSPSPKKPTPSPRSQGEQATSTHAEEKRQRAAALHDAGAPSKSTAQPHIPEPAEAPGSSMDFARALLAGNLRCRSWREKLGLVHSLLAEQTGPLTAEQLADTAIYLRLLGTGQIACVEDGRHFRPAHHARLSLQIHQRLAGLPEPELRALARRIYPWLPSFAPEFQRAEPLTRIRDIAHRNDLPSDLKREIKTTLQNKLHRCAGPEDLATSSVLLQRITAPGAQYSAAFVEQFRIFHEELKEFFNARNLEERFRALPQDADAAPLIRTFLEHKNAAGLGEQLALFHSLTRLRRLLLQKVAAAAAESGIEWLQADIALEDFVFVLVSELINFIAPETASSQESAPPQALLEVLGLCLENLSLSQVTPDECVAVRAELAAWQTAGGFGEREHQLRLKATAERARRLAEDYSDRLLGLFPPRVALLGPALGVPEHAQRVFCEAEIRSHLIFQLSKLASGLLLRLRHQLRLPPWDVIVPGEAAGPVEALLTLDQHEAGKADCVVLLRKAEGDEEIPEGIAAILVAHEVPHLSHLGVRARQARIVFAASSEPSAFKALEILQGQDVAVRATPDQLECSAAAHAGYRTVSHATRHKIEIPKTEECGCAAAIALEQATAARAGSKADGARRLALLAGKSKAGFKTPPGLALPFGVLEALLQGSASLADHYQTSVAALARNPNDETAAASLRALLAQTPVPEKTLDAVREAFPANARLMIRSSANCEDIQEFAGAGLYESVANVTPEDLEEALRTVWGSLWTRRAIQSRAQAGIPQAQARMAILLQQMVEPEYSFILHTVNPLSQSPEEVYMELAPGLGETLASATARGTPYRMVCNTRTHSVRVLSFANFSTALRPDPAGGTQNETLDYSRLLLSTDSEARTAIAQRLGQVARLVEHEFGSPQDIEGAIVGPSIYLVQSRAQQGLRK